MSKRQLRDETIVHEMGELVDEYNRAVKRMRNEYVFRQSVTVVEKSADVGAAIWGGPIAGGRRSQ